MYGKIFETLWTGSMRGFPDMQLVFIYMLCNCDEDGNCDIVPQVIADATGLEDTRVADAIVKLSAEDQDSRSPDAGGRRIENIEPHRDWGWHIINYEKYRQIVTESQRREYNRERQKKHRMSHQMCDNALSSAFAPSSTSGDRDTQEEGFAEFWKVYPKKKKKFDALKAWKQTKTVRPDLPVLIAAIQKQKCTHDWQKDQGQYIPLPASWLRAGQWDDVVEQPKQRESGI